MKKFGKKYKAANALVDSMKVYTLEEAVALLAKTSTTKFDPTIEIGIKTHANPKYNDQNIRASIILPHGTGKKVTVAVFTSEDKFDEAKKAGADIVGNKELIEQITKGEINFDVLVTEVMMMRDLAKVAKILGPKGLMPSPKAGTATTDIAKAVDNFKKGQIEFRADKTGNVHAGLGKLSFGPEKLQDNIKAFINALNDNKPTGVKAKLIKKITIATTMGPGITIES